MPKINTKLTKSVKDDNELHYSNIRNVTCLTENTPVINEVCIFCTRKLANKYSCARHMVTCKAKASFPVPDAYFPVPDAYFPVPDALNPVPDALNPVLDFTGKPTAFKCDTCYKSFSRKQYLLNHIDYCKKIQHPHECYKCHKVLSCDGNLSRHLQICNVNPPCETSIQPFTSLSPSPPSPSPIIQIHIEHLHGNMNTNNTQNNTNNTLTNNINVNSFGHEDRSHIDQVFIDKCLRGMLGDGVPNMVKRLHLDPNTPENHNVQIYSKKHSLMKIKEDNEWNIKDRNDVLDQVIHNSLALLYNSFHNPDSEIKKEDEQKHFNAIAIRMLEISNKLPRVHFPLRRKVYALVLNLCDQLTDMTKDI